MGKGDIPRKFAGDPAALEREVIGSLEDLKRCLGRPVRILHMGNIANNAYNNAKLLNKFGLDCDVICGAYFHIMGCPEWEDADFEGDYLDQFYPAWENVNLRGFHRPKWFAQGPKRANIHYLIARRKNKALQAIFWWRILKVSSRLACALARRGYLPLIKHSFRVISSIRNALEKIRTFRFNIVFKQGVSDTSDHSKPSYSEFHKDLIERFLASFPDRKDQLTSDDLMFTDDLMFSYSTISKWKELFTYYDIIQAYSIDGIIALLAEKRPYCCFEHGTLRSIPFESNAQGRRTALCYHMADHVFVTNADCLENAKSLADRRVSFINHPYDEDHGLNRRGWKKLRNELCEQLSSEFLFFFPTRHDWVSGGGYADKANDQFLHAFIRLRYEGYKCGMVCCEWGANVEESKRVLQEGGCSREVLWRKPMGTVAFERTALACHVVVDQFKLGSFGGILFKAMALGVPVCTYLNEDEILDRYDELPPVINCQNEEEIVSSMREIIDEPSVLKQIGVRSRDWIKTYHNSTDTVRLQLEAYKKCLDASGQVNCETTAKWRGVRDEA
jgi:hypothetical protein